MARVKKLKARPRESIHEIRAAGRESERRAKEKSWICLCPFGALDKSVIAQKIACDFLSDLRFFFSPSAVENRLRFSTADEGPFSERKRTDFLRLLRSRGKFQKKGERFPLPGKEKSSIFLFAVCRRKSLAIFDGRRGSFFLVLFFRLAFFSPSHRWLGKKILPFFPIPSESEERPSPQIPLESEGTRSQKKRTNLPRLRYFLLFLVLFLSEKGRLFPELAFFSPSHKWLGKKIFRSRGKYRNSKKFALFSLREKRARSRGKYQKKDGFSPNSRFFLRAINGSGKKSCLSFRFLWNRKNGRPLRFLWNLRGPGVGGNIGRKKSIEIGGTAVPSDSKGI